jgi:tetratricopeptide (TPR) repeat protein
MKTGDVVADRFVIERLAGSGAMGAVYTAIDRASGERVAVKILRPSGAVPERGPSEAARFSREAQALRALAHPNIVRYVAHGDAGPTARFLAMEWLDGEDLGKRLSRGPMSVEETLLIARSIASALAAAHDQGVIHRDVKPTNLFLVGGDVERVRVLDFGVARFEARSQSTRTGAVLGTPAYMAPEQARGQRDVDARADVFSLGCVIFECLTGQPPFSGGQVLAVLAKILLAEAPRLSASRADVPASLDDLVARMLSKSKHDRPRDAAAVREQLDVIASTGEPSRTPRSLVPSSRNHLLGDDEQRIASVLFVAPDPESVTDPTIAVGSAGPLEAIVTSAGGRLEGLADGSTLIVLDGDGAATDRATQAARCALSLHGASPAVPIVVATGRAVVGGRAIGEAIDRAARLLSALPETASGVVDIQLDEVTAGLLDARFTVRSEGGRFALLEEHETADNARMLLGRPTPFVGRDRELRALEGLFDQAAEEGTARLGLVTGPAGSGKSRLRFELGQRIAPRASAVWLARGEAMRAATPYSMIGAALRTAAGVVEGDGALGAAKLTAWVAERVDADEATRVAEFCAEIAGLTIEEPSVQLRAARADAALMGDQLFRAVEDLVSAQTRDGALALILDDLHWADRASVDLVDRLARHLSDAPLFILALARPDVTQRFPALWAERGLEMLQLGDLTKRGAEKLVRGALERVDDATIASIVERASGNPFYIEELVRAVASGNRPDVLPPTVVAMVEARVSSLPSEARRVLRAASVFGLTFRSAGVSALCGANDLDGTLDDLCAREVIARRPNEDGVHTFRHAIVREAAYAMLTPDDRALGHRLAAEHLERLPQTPPSVLAEHLELAGEASRASAFYARAAVEARDKNDLDGAVEHADRAIRCGAEDADAMRLLTAEVLRWRGKNAESLAMAIELSDRFAPSSAPWFVARGLVAAASGRLGDKARVLDVAFALQAAIEAAPMSPQAAIESARTATHTAFLGEVALGLRLLDRVEHRAAALALEHPLVRAHLAHARGALSFFAGDPSAVLEHMELAAAAFTEAGDLRSASNAGGNVGYAYAKLGAFESARETLESTRIAADRLHLPLVVATVDHNLGFVLAALGRLEEARLSERAAMEAFANKDTRLWSASAAYLAEIELAAGDLEGAARDAERAVAIGKDVASLVPLLEATLASVRLAQRRLAEALELAERAHRALERGGIEEGEAKIRLIYALALDENGDRGGARAVIDKARGRLLERAATISSQRLRASFLARSECAAETMRLAEAWADTLPPKA